MLYLTHTLVRHNCTEMEPLLSDSRKEVQVQCWVSVLHTYILQELWLYLAYIVLVVWLQLAYIVLEAGLALAYIVLGVELALAYIELVVEFALACMLFLYLYYQAFELWCDCHVFHNHNKVSPIHQFCEDMLVQMWEIHYEYFGRGCKLELVLLL